MTEYMLNYSVVIEAEDEDQAECLSIELEASIKFCSKQIIEVSCDPYTEELDD